ncbi:hypothetical protein [Salinispora sp. H7-4]|uniref:hypothetical protein n=1 Tax=Salinispora sp. H7-4 TaxID=2748321 RepID=UPI0015D3D861|nr:hypothetical protein [Salinispora sp. H7-4]NYT94203.1 hypothetical protein [Salinispora sp. H7-4]
MRSPWLATPALAVCLALSACGSGQGAGAGPPTEMGATPVTTPADPEPTAADSESATPAAPRSMPASVPTRTPKVPAGPSKPPPVGAATLTGTVQAGVEPGCLLLDGYLLVGGPRAVLTPGASVLVTGKIQPDVVTICQQGIPFLVETASRQG